MSDRLKILDRFANVRVLVAGDVMLDRYWWGTVSRISPEAPVPVLKLEKVTSTAGGAANVAANVQSLGATAFLVGAIGADECGRLLPQILTDCGVAGEHLVTIENRPTTTKTRIVAHQQHVVRIDDENPEPLDARSSQTIWQRIESILHEVDAVVLSDYAKGCLTASVLANTIETARKLGKPVLVDPKGTDYQKYLGATLLTPNKSEAAAASGLDIRDYVRLESAGKKLLESLALESLLITLGEDGMRLFQKNQKSEHFKANARQVYDVTGAGDTVIAALAVALGANADLATAALIANCAAGLAVEQVGTAAVSNEQLRRILSE